MAETSMRQVWVCNEEVQSFDMMSFLPRGLYATFSTTYRTLSCSPSALVELANERRKSIPAHARTKSVSLRRDARAFVRSRTSTCVHNCYEEDI